MRRDLIILLGGIAVAWLVVARAQQPMPVIGYLSVGSQESDKLRLSAFRQGLGESGYVEGQNVVIEYRWAEGEYDRLAALAGDLTGRQVTVIVSGGGTDLADSYRQLGLYAARILDGARPADLPVRQVVKLELIINLNTAKALGLTIPPILLARADEVIE
jgi:ABC-type uncharacterized transport system substrate-binding protein